MSNISYKAVLSQTLAGHLCDVGHYYCPYVREDGSIIFPSGKLSPDGKFSGAKRLGEMLAQLAEVSDPPVHPHDRYPSGTGNRRCLSGCI